MKRPIYFVPQDARIICPDELERLLNEAGGVRKLAKQLGTTPSTVSRSARQLGIALERTSSFKAVRQ